jgi:hypothetical protein
VTDLRIINDNRGKLDHLQAGRQRPTRWRVGDEANTHRNLLVMEELVIVQGTLQRASGALRPALQGDAGLGT